MSDNDRNCSNEAVEKIIGNMTAEMQSQDGGQYVPLAYTPPPSEPRNWPQSPNTYINNYNPYNAPPDMPITYGSLDQFGQLNRQPPPFTYLQQPPVYNLNGYKNDLKYDIYETMQNGGQENAMYGGGDYLTGAPLGHPMGNQHETQPSHSTQRTHLIENLVGNWVPNTSGTYSPFGNVEPFKSNVGVFEQLSERDNVIGQIREEPVISPEQLMEDKQFPFKRTPQLPTRKPRMVAEVKPMRPSYSDVLIKPVPPTNNSSGPSTKTTKNVDGIKDNNAAKPKKDLNKSKTKSEKGQKGGSSLNRSNTSNDIKDVPDKVGFVKTLESNKSSKSGKNGQLNRKWASLDDINEPLGATKVEETRKKKEDLSGNRSFQKANFKKAKTNGDSVDLEMTANRNEPVNVSKNGLKKTNKFGTRQNVRNPENLGNNNERPPGKRNQRSRKRENHVLCGVIGQKLRQYLKSWCRIITVSLIWLLNLVSDILSLSAHISRDMGGNFWLWLRAHWAVFLESTLSILKRVRMFTWLYERFKKKEGTHHSDQDDPKQKSFLHSGLQNNINMPTTGEEAMKRLQACKGKDPYSILGVTPTCTDDDIKRYYKRQAFLVHPDKNQQPGAEEAFKILVHAFDMIGEPERRASYDKGVVESVQVEQAWSELTELLAALQQKVEAAANTIRCSACGLRHKKVKVERPSYAARNCASCKIHHAAREGDIWAEAKCFGFLWHYYACMEGGVHDITEWAGCQKDSLKHLKPDSHQVQYRIALGKQSSQPRRHSGSPRGEKPPDLENLLNTLYGQADGAPGPGARRRSKKAK